MRITAIFIGKTSIGFVNGTRYELNLTETFPLYISDLTPVKSLIKVETTTINGENKLRCEYSKASKFLENWKIEKFVDSSNGWSYQKHSDVRSEILNHMRSEKINILID